MKNFLKSKDFYLALFFACIGVLGIWILAKHIHDWTGNADFWLPENFNPYDLTEAVHRWSHAVYFTNITLFLFCILTFLNLIAEISVDWACRQSSDCCDCLHGTCFCHGL